MGDMADFINDSMETEDSWTGWTPRHGGNMNAQATTNTRSNLATPEGIVSYPHLTAPSLNKLKLSAQYPTGTPEFSVMLIWLPGTDLRALVQACEDKLLEMFRVRPPGPPGLKAWRDAGYKVPLRRSEEKMDQGVFPPPHVAGGIWCVFRSQQQPLLGDENVQPIIAPGKIYGGCIGRVGCQPYAYSKAGNKGVNLGLRTFQFIRDGERLGGGGSDLNADFKPADRSKLDGDQSSLV